MRHNVDVRADRCRDLTPTFNDFVDFFSDEVEEVECHHDRKANAIYRIKGLQLPRENPLHDADFDWQPREDAQRHPSLVACQLLAE